ncbi:unnamed protein product [Ceutorhynchus assimilis]|uniref:E3 ubiquitin-protein ligase Topors n=1 Tax=Ceutorhynchus assimilis TaxID=467358 RepID=A0A9N9QFC3_9CUCU|nr:unnamed protein product [Ceutorhynchus assimilis]
MAMAPKMPIIRPNSANTPPNCAICLGGCTNKCFSDSCLHQFCFQCLLEWSKIKAECPLCKQPFKSILHNVISSEDYDEHVVEIPRNDVDRLHEDLWILPLQLPQRQEFHVRTTFTLDTGGEHAIHEMLLNHPITNGRITLNTELPRNTIHLIPSRMRRDSSSSSFRRSLYAQNLWVTARPDLTGRYRECSPTFFRSNPAARQRLVPWLNRELNALLYENTQLIMYLVDLILDRILNYHICSLTFRHMLREYLDNKTDHFVHEFYSFMRSPLDMTGYDRYSIYTNRPQSPAPIYDDDSRERVEILSNSEDSDVVLVEPTPAEPVTIDLVDTDSDDPILVSSWPSSTVVEPPSLPSTSPSGSSSPVMVSVSNLPPKLRYKKQMWVDRKNKRRWISSPEVSSSEISESEKESYRKYYKRRKMKKKLTASKKVNKSKSFSFDTTPTSTEVNISSQSDSDEDKPLIRYIKKMKQKNKKNKNKKRSSRRDQTMPDLSPTQIFPMDLSTASSSSSDVRLPSTSSSSLSNSRYHMEMPPKTTRSKVELSNNGQYTSVQIETLTSSSRHTEPSSSTTKIKIVRNELNSPPPQHSRDCSQIKIVRNGLNSPPPHHSRERGLDDSFSNASSESFRVPAVKSEIREVNPGPSTSKSTPLVLRRDRDNWFVFDNSDSSD